MIPRAWHLPLAVLGTTQAFALIGYFAGLETMLLALAGATLALAILLGYQSLLSLGGHVPLTLDEALTLAAPSSEEEQKRAVLRALKDLEFERSVGKISEADYQELVAQYRAHARALISSIDEARAGALAQAEALARARLMEVEPTTPANENPTPPEVPPALPSRTTRRSRKEHRKRRARPTCPACHETNPADARFCKHCGAPLRTPEEAP